MPIPSATLLRLAEEQNPWRQVGDVPSTLAPPVARPLAEVLWRRLANSRLRRFQIVLGPRRVGKTTVLYQTVQRLLRDGISAQRIWWWRLGHPLLAEASLGELVRAAVDSGVEHPVYVMLDEVVRAPDWDRWLKTFHDERWPVRIVATASAIGVLRSRTIESGVGRWQERHLMPYRFGEFLDLVGQATPPMTAGDSLAATLRMLPAGARPAPKLARWREAFLHTGGFPELLLPQTTAPAADPSEPPLPQRLLESQRVLRSDAVERAIYQDIPQAFGVDNPALLERLAYSLAGQTAGILAPERLARDLGLSQPTVARYLAYLERSFLVFALPNYSGTEARIQRRRRKLYFVDGAVRNAALQRGLALLDDPDELGVLQENLVAAALHGWPSKPAFVCTTGAWATTRLTWCSPTSERRWRSRWPPRWATPAKGWRRWRSATPSSSAAGRRGRHPAPRFPVAGHPPAGGATPGGRLTGAQRLGAAGFKRPPLPTGGSRPPGSAAGTGSRSGRLWRRVPRGCRLPRCGRRPPPECGSRCGWWTAGGR